MNTDEIQRLHQATVAACKVEIHRRHRKVRLEPIRSGDKAARDSVNTRLLTPVLVLIFGLALFVGVLILFMLIWSLTGGAVNDLHR